MEASNFSKEEHLLTYGTIDMLNMSQSKHKSYS